MATADEIEEVEAHVAECADCRGLVAQLAASAPVVQGPERTLVGFDEELSGPTHHGLEADANEEVNDGGVPAAGGVLAPGSVLGERYRIVRFLSKGGMGEVYAAEDLELRE